MKDFGEYVRLDRRYEAELLGITGGNFMGYGAGADCNDEAHLGERDFDEFFILGDNGGPPFKAVFRAATIPWEHVYILKSSIKAKSTELMEFINELKGIIEDIED